MVKSFALAQPMGLIRKAILIALATLALMLLWVSIAVCGGGPYEMGPDGIMRPDGTVVQYGDMPPDRQGQPHGQRQVFTYNSTRQSDGSYLITRNGAKWMTVGAKPGYFAITDPNGTGQLLIKLDQKMQSVQVDRSTKSPL